MEPCPAHTPQADSMPAALGGGHGGVGGPSQGAGLRQHVVGGAAHRDVPHQPFSEDGRGLNMYLVSGGK